MKHCPSCKTNYADDTLQFCLQDGTQLVTLSDAPSPTVAYSEEETVIRNRLPQQVVPINPDLPPPNTQPQQNWQTNPIGGAQYSNFPTEPKKSNTLVAVLLTALGMLLIFGVGISAWLYTRREKEIAVNVNTSPTVNRSPNTNSANNQNSNTPTPTLTPTPKPTLDPKEAKAVTEDVKTVVDAWKDGLENLSLDMHLAQYSDTVDYYKSGRVGIGKVRADKQRAFEAFDSIDVDISNMKVTPDETGDKATAVFDKEWTFEGAEKYSAGKVQQQLNFSRINGRWLITGEKDLKVYYVEK
jgi:hypothetical protein